MVKSKLKITTIQTNLTWHNPEINREKIDILFKEINSDTDLIILPEMFTTGFTMDSITFGEPLEGKTFNWLMSWAKQLNSAIIGTYIIVDNGKYFNCAVCVSADGGIYRYNKRHLFRMGDEEKFYTPGEEQIDFCIKGWKIRPLICYDLRFPVWSRNDTNYDILIYMANWPSSRSSIWSTLLSARSIENMCYVVGVNRVGTDGNGIEYDGTTTVLDFSGDTLYCVKDKAEVFTTELSMEKLLNFRSKFPAYMDQDSFSISI